MSSIPLTARTLFIIIYQFSFFKEKQFYLSQRKAFFFCVSFILFKLYNSWFPPSLLTCYHFIVFTMIHITNQFATFHPPHLSSSLRSTKPSFSRPIFPSRVRWWWRPGEWRGWVSRGGGRGCAPRCAPPPRCGGPRGVPPHTRGGGGGGRGGHGTATHTTWWAGQGRVSSSAHCNTLKKRMTNKQTTTTKRT